MFFMGEYVGMTVMACLMTTFFLGGWHFPGLTKLDDHSVLGGLLSMGGWLCGRGLFDLKVLADNFVADDMDEPPLPEGWEWVERLVMLSLDRRVSMMALAAETVSAT